MSLYDAIFTRRSVRRYQPEPLDGETLADIEAYLGEIDQLPGQQAAFRFITPEQMGMDQAPHYIVASCAANDAAYANVGYVLQKLDLYLQSEGFGSLWYGMRLPKERQDDDCIVMQLGRPVTPAREEESAFHRVDLAKMANADNPVTRAARLAPSAVNSQPWMIEWGEGTVTARYHGRGLIRARLEPKLSKIDLGIVSRVIAVALEHEGHTVTAVTPQGNGKKFALEIAYK